MQQLKLKHNKNKLSNQHENREMRKGTEQIDSLKKHHLKSQIQLGIILQPKNVKRAAGKL